MFYIQSIIISVGFLSKIGKYLHLISSEFFMKNTTFLVFLLLSVTYCFPSNIEFPLHAEIQKKNPNLETIQSLINNGANINERDEFSFTPLTKAIRKRHIRVATLLLENGADVNAADWEGKTPLHHAIARYDEGGDQEIELLLNNNADLNLRSDLGKDPLDCALGWPASYNYTNKILQHFLKHKDRLGYTTLDMIVRKAGFFGQLFNMSFSKNKDIYKKLQQDGAKHSVKFIIQDTAGRFFYALAACCFVLSFRY